MQAAQPQDPYRAMLRSSLFVSLPVAALALIATGVFVGSSGVWGAALGTVLVVASFGSTLLVMSRLRRSAAHLVMAVAMCLYLGKVFVLGMLLLLVQAVDLTWLSPTAFAASAVAVALAWLAGEMWAFAHVRTLVFDARAAPDTVTES